MKKWIIIGSRSGAGKSELIRQLSVVLANPVVVKLGHHPRKKDGWSNYFTDPDDALGFVNELDGKYEHCLMESSRFIGSVKSDTMIFLDAPAGDRRKDADSLRRKADIVISPNRLKGVQKGLKGMGLDRETTLKVVDVLENQKDYLSGNRFELRTKLWISREGQHVFGEGLARLLRGIIKHGSLSASARDERISYRHAWGEIKRAEERLGMELIKSTPGGSGGGGSSLTDQGVRLLEGYEEIRGRVIDDSDRYFRELVKEIDGSK